MHPCELSQETTWHKFLFYAKRLKNFVLVIDSKGKQGHIKTC